MHSGIDRPQRDPQYVYSRVPAQRHSAYSKGLLTPAQQRLNFWPSTTPSASQYLALYYRILSTTYDSLDWAAEPSANPSLSSPGMHRHLWVEFAQGTGPCRGGCYRSCAALRNPANIGSQHIQDAIKFPAVETASTPVFGGLDRTNILQGWPYAGYTIVHSPHLPLYSCLASFAFPTHESIASDLWQGVAPRTRSPTWVECACYLFYVYFGCPVYRSHSSQTALLQRFRCVL